LIFILVSFLISQRDNSQSFARLKFESPAIGPARIHIRLALLLPIGLRLRLSSVQWFPPSDGHWWLASARWNCVDGRL